MRVKKILNQLHSAGFTLTELMAVVIILAILAAVAAGSYKKAIERSHFAEGLSAAHTVLSGVETYYAENWGTDFSTKRPKISDLPIALSNPKACASPSNYCVKTKYFEVTINSNGSVTAKRSKGINYSIKVYPESMGFDTADQCTGNKDFCISVGYTTGCTSNSSNCTK